jgi:hypothetical protein
MRPYATSVCGLKLLVYEQDFATYAQKQERVNVTCVDLAALLAEHRVLRIDWLQVLRPQATRVA